MKLTVYACMLTYVACFIGFSVRGASAEAAAKDPDCITPTAIHFRHGTTAAAMTGTVERAEYACYTLGARAGQRLDVQVRSAEQNVVLIAYRPGYVLKQDADGPDVSGPTLAGAGEQDEAMAVHGKLDQTGTYLFLLGSTRGSGGTYTLHATVK